MALLAALYPISMLDRGRRWRPDSTIRTIDMLRSPHPRGCGGIALNVSSSTGCAPWRACIWPRAMAWSVPPINWSDELREEGLRCEHMLLALKALLKRGAAEPRMLISEIVPLCITYYYKPPSPPGRDRALSSPGSRR